MYVSLVSARPPCLLLSMLLTMTPSTAPGTASPPRATRWSRSPLPASTTAGTIRWRHATMSRGTRRSCGLRARGRAQLTPVCDQRASCGIRTRRGCTLAVTDRWARYTCCTRAECEMRLRRDVVGSGNYLGYLRPLICFHSRKVQNLAFTFVQTSNNHVQTLAQNAEYSVAGLESLPSCRRRRLEASGSETRLEMVSAQVSGLPCWYFRCQTMEDAPIAGMAFVFGVLEASSASCR